MSESGQKESDLWIDQLKKLQTAIFTANENGLFSDAPDVYKTIVNETVDALIGLSEQTPQVAAAKTKYSHAYNELNALANSRKFTWRFLYYYGGPAIIYFIAFFLAILTVWFLFGGKLVNYTVVLVPSWAFLWGAMGGVLNGFWRVWQHACYREIRKVWYAWYVVLPLMGALLGALIYLLVLGGLIATTGSSQIQSQYFIMLLCALGGFSAKWAVDLLDALTKVIQIRS